MRRTERLLHFAERLRAARNPVTALALADEFSVSERTVYRDIRLLTDQGLPITGEPGVGYVMASGYNAPALQFTPDELEILSIGLRLVFRDGDEPMQRAAESILSKIRTGLNGTTDFDSIGLYATGERSSYETPLLTWSRLAIRKRLVIEIEYKSIDGDHTSRRVKPLALLFFHNATLLAGWCELREDFRNFRVDLIQAFQTTSESFQPEHYRLRRGYLETIKHSSPDTQKQESVL